MLFVYYVRNCIGLVLNINKGDASVLLIFVTLEVRHLISYRSFVVIPQVSLVSSSSEPSPEPLFDMHDLHGQAALHVAARLGQAQVVKVRTIAVWLVKMCLLWDVLRLGSFGSWCKCRSGRCRWVDAAQGCCVGRTYRGEFCQFWVLFGMWPVRSLNSVPYKYLFTSLFSCIGRVKSVFGVATNIFVLLYNKLWLPICY